LNISLKYIILSYAYQLPLFTKRQFTYRSDNGHTGARDAKHYQMLLPQSAFVSSGKENLIYL